MKKSRQKARKQHIIYCKQGWKTLFAQALKHTNNNYTTAMMLPIQMQNNIK